MYNQILAHVMIATAIPDEYIKLTLSGYIHITLKCARN